MFARRFVRPVNSLWSKFEGASCCRRHSLQGLQKGQWGTAGTQGGRRWAFSSVWGVVGVRLPDGFPPSVAARNLRQAFAVVQKNLALPDELFASDTPTSVRAEPVEARACRVRARLRQAQPERVGKRRRLRQVANQVALQTFDVCGRFLRGRERLGIRHPAYFPNRGGSPESTPSHHTTLGKRSGGQGEAV